MSDEYSQEFGRTAQTLEYIDIHGQVIFTFDVGSKGGKSIVLEHYLHPWHEVRDTTLLLTAQSSFSKPAVTKFKFNSSRSRPYPDVHQPPVGGNLAAGSKRANNAQLFIPDFNSNLASID